MAGRGKASGRAVALVLMRSVACLAVACVVGVMPVPSADARSVSGSPYLAGTMPEVEHAILQALQASNVASSVGWIAADTNGHLTVAGLGLVYKPGPPDPLPLLQTQAWTVVQTAFATVPTLDEVDLSAVPEGDGQIDPSHPNVVFSLAASRSEVLAPARGLPASEVLARLPRIWYQSMFRQPSRGGRVESPSAKPKQTSPQTLTGGQLKPTSPSGPPQHFHGGSSAVAIRLVVRGDPAHPEVAVTFDDGPFPIYTTLLLDTLERLEFKATFFLVGEQVERYPYFALGIVRAGHEIGNHTFHHVRLALLPEDQIEEEIAHAQDVIVDATGVTPRYFRPPGGRYSATVLRTASALGLTTVLWTANSGDYANPDPRVLQAKILGRVGAGGILLLHQGVGETIRLLPQAIDTLRRRGLVLTTISGLLAAHPGAAR